MKTENFSNFIKDTSKAVKTVANKPETLQGMSEEQFEIFRGKVAGYNPKKADGQYAKAVVEKLITEQVEERGKTAEVLTESGVKTAMMVAEKTTILELHIRQPGFMKRIDSATFLDKSGNNGNVSAEVLHVHQDLIDMTYPKTLLKHRAKTLEYIRAWEVPAGILTPGGGQYLVPLQAADAIYKKMDEFAAERKELLDEFEKEWDAIIKDAKKKRGVFFNSSDYPSFASVRAKYTHDFKFVANRVDEALKQISQEAFNRETEHFMVKCSAAVTEIQTGLREGFGSLVEHFVERLGVDEKTGKPVRFNEKRLTDMMEFIESFQTRNVTNDRELDALCNKAKELLTGVDAEKIRKDQDVRASLKTAFDQMIEATDELIGTSTRKVRVAAAAGGE